MDKKFGIQHKNQFTRGTFWDFQDIVMNHTHAELFPQQQDELTYAPPPTDKDNPWAGSPSLDDISF